MSNTGAQVMFFTGSDGEDCQVQHNGKVVDLFSYQFDVDELMCDFDWTMFDFEVYIAILVGSPVKLYWINVENEVDQHFIFRLEEPSECDVIYVCATEVEDTCVFDIYGFDVPRPQVRTPGVNIYEHSTHSQHIAKFPQIDDELDDF